MLKYTVAAVAAIYCTMIIFGDETRRPEVARQAQNDITGLSLAAFADSGVPSFDPAIEPRMSEAEAIQIALDAGAAHRADRKRAPLLGMIEAVEAVPAADNATSQQDAMALYYVSGTRVNLRAGPGTGNAVVGQVALGDAAEVLSSENGWMQIRLADGQSSGWIYGKFLADQKPG